MKFGYKNKAFSLAELLLCLGIISVVAALLVPSLGRVKPDKSKTMFKKVNHVTERVIYELVNDAELYPDVEDFNGFDNTQRVRFNDREYGADKELNIVFQGDETDLEKEEIREQAKQDAEDRMKRKFCELFALKVNTLSSEPNCSNDPEVISFETTDGVQWKMPYTNFPSSVEFYPIYVDVNGDKAPNVMDTLSGDPNDCTEEVDRFEILVKSNGEMSNRGACATKYLRDRTLIHDQD